MATPSNPLSVIEGAFVLLDPGGDINSHSPTQIANASADLQIMFSHAVAGLTPTTLPEPGLCTYGKERTKNDLYRFRWFDIFTIGGKNYGLGANLHSKGYLGGMWMIGLNVVQTPELHPHKQPTIPNKPAWQSYLRTLVSNGTFLRKLKK